MPLLPRLGALAAALILVPVASAAPAEAPVVAATLETPPVYDDEQGGTADSDDPGIWVDRAHPADSLVVATKKNAGLDVFDLSGTSLQGIIPQAGPTPGSAPGRFNNVDIAEGMRLGSGHRRIDVAVVSDRGRDRIRVYAIDPDAKREGRPPLSEITAPGAPRVFSASEAAVDEQATAYGLAVWQPGGDGRVYVSVSQRSRTAVALLELIPRHDGTVTYRRIDRLALPASFRLPDRSRWAPCNDPGDLAQVEGQVFDGSTLWLGQEDIGIWKVGVARQGFKGMPVLVDRTREFGIPAEFDAAEDECVQTGPDPGFGGEHLSADVEGLTIAGDRLLVSSQGDDTFAAYGTGRRNAYLGSFGIALGDDRVQESDGADVVLRSLGAAFPHGLLVTQDGDATGPDVDPDRDDPTNFKFTDWARVVKLR